MGMDYKLKGDKFNLEAVWAKLRMASVLNNSYLLGITNCLLLSIIVTFNIFDLPPLYSLNSQNVKA
jgi:hypothetical protein